jgi:hypothetical protein
MSQVDGYQLPPVRKVHETWALRNVNGIDVLVISSTNYAARLRTETRLKSQKGLAAERCAFGFDVSDVISCGGKGGLLPTAFLGK